jgi:HD-GYP domain-containing protein (c-di-GMP phosphodiesterase class II)
MQTIILFFYTAVFHYELRGEEITVMSRILCVADAVDSMLADRPYRKGLQ